jgi:hypothetical protein
MTFADRIEKLVDRRTDGDDDRTIPGDAVGRMGEDETPAAQRFAQHVLGAVLDERQPAGLQCTQGFPVEIVDVDPQAGFGERQHQRHTDMAGAADNGHVGVFDGRRRVRAGDIRPHGHRSFSPLVSTKGRNRRMIASSKRVASMKL